MSADHAYADKGGGGNGGGNGGGGNGGGKGGGGNGGGGNGGGGGGGGGGGNGGGSNGGGGGGGKNHGGGNGSGNKNSGGGNGSGNKNHGGGNGSGNKSNGGGGKNHGGGKSHSGEGGKSQGGGAGKNHGGGHGKGHSNSHSQGDGNKKSGSHGKKDSNSKNSSGKHGSSSNKRSGETPSQDKKSADGKGNGKGKGKGWDSKHGAGVNKTASGFGSSKHSDDGNKPAKEQNKAADVDNPKNTPAIAAVSEAENTKPAAVEQEKVESTDVGTRGDSSNKQTAAEGNHGQSAATETNGSVAKAETEKTSTESGSNRAAPEGQERNVTAAAKDAEDDSEGNHVETVVENESWSADQFGALNAVNASTEAFVNAAPDSRIGLLRSYFEANQAAERAAQTVSEVKAKLEASTAALANADPSDAGSLGELKQTADNHKAALAKVQAEAAALEATASKLLQVAAQGPVPQNIRQAVNNVLANKLAGLATATN